MIFTSGTTAAVNLVAQSWLFNNSKLETGFWSPRWSIIPILFPQQLCKQLGIELDYWTVDREGRLDLEELNQLLSENTKLVAMTAISNVLGSINPVGEVVKRAHSMVQQFLLMLHRRSQECRSMSRNGIVTFSLFQGMLYGPTGIGALGEAGTDAENESLANRRRNDFKS